MASLFDKLDAAQQPAKPKSLFDKLDELSMPSAREDIPAIEATAEDKHKLDREILKRINDAQKALNKRGLKEESKSLGGIEYKMGEEKDPFKTVTSLATQSGANAEDMAKLRKAQQSAKKESGKGFFEDLKDTSVEKALTVLDTGGRVTRNAVMAATGDSKFEPGKAFINDPTAAGVDPEQYIKHLEEGKTASARGLNTAFDIAATPAKGLVALKNLAFGDDLQTAWKTAEKSGKDFTTLALSDISNAVTLGGGGAAVAGKQGTRMAKAAGMGAKEAAAFGKQFALKSAEVGGKVSSGKELMDFAKGAGISDKAIVNTLGKQGELAGRRGFAIAGKDVAIPGLPEQALVRGKNAAVAKIGEGIEKVLPKSQMAKLMQLPTAQREALLQTISKTQSKLDASAAKGVEEQLANIKSNPKLQEIYKHKDVLNAEAEAIYDDIVKGSRAQASQDLKAYAASPEIKQLGPQVSKRVGDIVESRLESLTPKSGMKQFRDAITNHIREVSLFPRPAYMVQNVLGDTFLAAQKGMASFKGAKAAIDVLGNAPVDAVLVKSPYANLTKGQLIKEMEDQGLLHGLSGGVGNLGQDIAPSLKDVKRGMYQASGQRTPLSLTSAENIAAVPTLGLNKLGKGLAQKWENFEKAAAFAELRSQGFSPAAAAQKMEEAIFNYKNAGANPAALNLFKEANPMGGWIYRAVKAVPEGVAQSPMLSKVPMNVSRTMNKEDPFADDPIRKGAREKGLPITVSKSGRNVANKILGAVGLPQFPPGMGMAVMARDPVTDVASNFRGEQIYEGGHPLTKVAIDLQKGETPYGEKLSVTGAPKYLGRILGQTALGSIGQTAIDIGTTLADVKNPLTGYDPHLDPYAKQKLLPKVLRFGTGLNLEQTAPGIDVREAFYSKENQSLKDKLEAAAIKAARYKKANKRDKQFE